MESALAAGGTGVLSAEAFGGTDAVSSSPQSQEALEHAVEHQLEMGVEPNEAVARVRRTALYEPFDPVGEYSVDSEVSSALGTEPVPPVLETDSASHRVLVKEDPALTSGIHADKMWRYTYSGEDRMVYGQDVSEYDYGPRTLVAEETLSEFGVKTPEYHYDPGKQYVRASHIQGDDLGDIQSALDSDSEATVDELSVDPDEIDRGAYVGAVAGMALSGNHDLNPGNIRIDTDGEATLIDNDNVGLEKLTQGKMDRLAEKGAGYGSDIGLEVSEDDVRDRIYEMADETDPDYIQNDMDQTSIDRMALAERGDSRIELDSNRLSELREHTPMNEDSRTVHDASDVVAANIDNVRQREIPKGDRYSADETGTEDSMAGASSEEFDEEVVSVADTMSMEPVDVENMITMKETMQNMSRSEAIEQIRENN